MEVATPSRIEVNQKAAVLSDRSPTSGHWNDKEKEEEAVERRRFLGGFTAASLGVLLESSSSEPARAQTGARLAS